MQELLGFASYDGTAHRGGMLGLYENGDPAAALMNHTPMGRRAAPSSTAGHDGHTAH